MATYLLGYDLLNETNGRFDYEPLWKELKRLGAHRTQLSLWLLNVSEGPQQVIEHFQKFADKDDALWVTRIRAGEHWYSNAKAGTNEWFKLNPPT